MALINCAECGREMSSDALICPACGKPNTAAQNKQTNTKQAAGCAIIILAGMLALVLPPLVAGIIFVIGLVVMVVNTRFK